MLLVRILAIGVMLGNVLSVQGDAMKKITLTSSEFQQGQPIPKKYTCDGQDINPPLAWTGVPAEAKSLVLICSDPDAPKGTWVHWIVFNIPAHVRSFVEGIEIDQVGAVEGTTSFGRPGYGGPCPPSGVHRYYFKIYALDSDALNLAHTATRDDIEAAMQNHVVAQGELMGTYTRVT